MLTRSTANSHNALDEEYTEAQSQGAVRSHSLISFHLSSCSGPEAYGRSFSKAAGDAAGALNLTRACREPASSPRADRHLYHQGAYATYTVRPGRDQRGRRPDTGSQDPRWISSIWRCVNIGVLRWQVFERRAKKAKTQVCRYGH